MRDLPFLDTALALARDASLRTRLGAASERVAVMLGEPPQAVLVTAAGITCLELGEQHDAPIVACEAITDGAFQRLWQVMRDAGQRLPREVMQALVTVAPLCRRPIFDAFEAHVNVLRAALRDAERLAALRRPSATEQAQLERLWCDVWLLGHLLVLQHAAPHEALTHRYQTLVRHSARAALGPFLLAVAIPFGPLQARVAWAFARVGEPLLAPALAAFVQSEPFYPDPDALAYALAALATASPRLRERVLTGLRGKRRDGRTAPVAAHFIADHLEHEAPQRDLAAVNVAADGLMSDTTLVPMLAMLPALAIAPPAALYTSEAELATVPTWTPAATLELLRHLCDVQSTLHAPTAPAPTKPSAPARQAAVGRNDPCPCGSGKKFKKCHGA